MTRLEIHNKLLTVCDHVYFQTPETFKMTYPCIRYERSSGLSEYASNFTYKFNQGYNLTYISKDPDSEEIIKSLLLMFPTIRYVRHYTADNLNHDLFTLYEI